MKANYVSIRCCGGQVFISGSMLTLAYILMSHNLHIHIFYKCVWDVTDTRYFLIHTLLYSMISFMIWSTQHEYILKYFQNVIIIIVYLHGWWRKSAKWSTSIVSRCYWFMMTSVMALWLLGSRGFGLGVCVYACVCFFCFVCFSFCTPPWLIMSGVRRLMEGKLRVWGGMVIFPLCRM